MSEKDIDVMIVEADKKPYMASIPNDMECIKEIVGGEIQTINLDNSDVMILCNKNAYINGREPNRIIFDKEGEPRDIICGNFIIVGKEGNDNRSLSIGEARECYRTFCGPMFYGIEEDKPISRMGYGRINGYEYDELSRECSWDEEREFWN